MSFSILLNIDRKRKKPLEFGFLQIGLWILEKHIQGLFFCFW